MARTKLAARRKSEQNESANQSANETTRTNQNNNIQSSSSSSTNNNFAIDDVIEISQIEATIAFNQITKHIDVSLYYSHTTIQY